MKTYKSFITILFIFSLLSGLFYFTDTEARQQVNNQKVDFLRKIAKASREISYSATIHKEYFYTQDSIGVYEKKVIKIDEGNMLQQFTYPERRTNTITIKKGDVYYHKRLNSDTVYVTISSGVTNVGSEISDDTYLLKRNYDFIFLRTEKIGKYVTDVVKVVSKYRDRDWLQMWVGPENGFIFRLERYDSEDKKVYQEYVEDVVLSPEINKELFEIGEGKIILESRRSDRKEYDNLADVETMWNKPLLVPKFTPSGFILERISTFKRRNNNYIQLDYTDGLSYISLFQREAKGEKRDLGIGSSFEANKRITRIIEIRNDVALTLFSDLPEDTLLSLFKSLMKKEDEEADSK
ncbi:hypothetical protein ACFL6O_06085 [candidate division KSB1 bacterium]